MKTKDLDPYQQILQKTFNKCIPFNAQWELTYRCNISCVHCYATNRSGRDELTAREIEDGLAQLADMGCLFLVLTGGEILLRDDIEAILRATKRNGFATSIFTNGTLLTPALADMIGELEPLSVEMSLYAVKPEIHDRITGTPGSYAKTMAAIGLCRERGVRLTLKSSLMRYNLSEFDALAEFVKSIRARFVFDYLLVPADDGSRPMRDHGLTEEQIRDFVKKKAAPGRKRPAVPPGSSPVCGAGANALCINPAGDVFPCLAFRKSIGNLREAPLRTIWRSSELDEIRHTVYDCLVDCRDCKDAAYCSRCSGIAYAECGNALGKSETACIVARATRQALEGVLTNGNRIQ